MQGTQSVGRAMQAEPPVGVTSAIDHSDRAALQAPKMPLFLWSQGRYPLWTNSALANAAADPFMPGAASPLTTTRCVPSDHNTLRPL